MSSNSTLSIPGSLEVVAATAPHGIAIVAHGRAPLTYGRLYPHLLEVGRMLNALGVGRGDRVALVAPSGPETAVALLAVAASATCVPLNASCSTDEFVFYLGDANASAVIVSANVDSPVRRVARQRGIPILELSAQQSGTAGLITVTGDAQRRTPHGGVAGPNDTAVVSYTSGTAGRPKKGPVTQAKLCIRAQALVRALGLTEEDRCLDLMPLCYAVGFNNLAATLAAGASIAWPSGSDPDSFFAALDEYRPSWYAAPPPAHTAILARAADHAGVIAARPLRFIRCGAAALPPQVLTELERAFNAPVVVTYGMTETMLISSTALPPASRKVGSVGLVDAATVAILDEAGRARPAGEDGEIAVRGPSVFDGYEDDPSATKAAFVNGWFKTGDRGVIDADGFLYIRGRIKEIISRGGAKVSPRAVEDVLLTHPGVQEAVVFGMPHRTLGEDLAAAVVLRPDAHATDDGLREFAAARLADFEVPSRIAVVREIPKGPTGKVQRHRLADWLTAVVASPHVTPTTPTEQAIAEIWARELRVGDVGIHDNFFELGGDSLSAVRMVSEIHRRFGTALPLAILLRASTVSHIARIVDQAGIAPPWPSLVPLRTHGTRPPLFCIHGARGNILKFRELAHLLGSDQPVYALQSQGLDGVRVPYTRIEEMAAHYLREIEAVAPEHPKFLCGHSMGGLIALEMAQQLRAIGRRVSLLVLLDTGFVSVPGLDTPSQRIAYHVGRFREYGLRSALKSGYDAARQTAP